MLKKQLSQVGSPIICPVAVILRNGKVLMGLRHYTHKKWKTVSVWTCPGGRCDNDETVEITLRRETQEETGITNLEIIDYIGEVPGAKEGDVVPLFFCRTSQNEKLMEPKKFSEWIWADLDNFPDDFINESARQLIVSFIKNRK